MTVKEVNAYVQALPVESVDNKWIKAGDLLFKRRDFTGRPTVGGYVLFKSYAGTEGSELISYDDVFGSGYECRPEKVSLVESTGSVDLYKTERGVYIYASWEVGKLETVCVPCSLQLGDVYTLNETYAEYTVEEVSESGDYASKILEWMPPALRSSYPPDNTQAALQYAYELLCASQGGRA